MKLLPIGSIIKVKKHKLCIIGYTSMSKEEETQCGYYVVPYPIGYISLDKTLFISSKEEVEVIAYGYQNEDSKAIVGLLETYFKAAEVISSEKIPTIVDAYKKAIDNLMEEE